MDYHSLKRKELQALCKKHNIAANSANSVLANKLSALLNEKQKPLSRQRTCMKSTNETTEEGEPASFKRQKKKVRFSPSNDLVEYELRSGKKQNDMVTQIKTRRKSVAKKVEKLVVDDNTTVELVDDSADVPVKLTRSRVQSSGKDVIPKNEKRQSRREAKDVDKEADVDKQTDVTVHKVTRSKAHASKISGGAQHEESKRLNKDAEKASEIVEETVVSRARVTRSKAQTLIEGGTGPDVNPRIKKKSGKQVETDRQNGEISKENLDIPVRATRSTRQTLKEDIGNTVTNPPGDKKRTRREMKATDLSSNSSHVAPVDKPESPKRNSLRRRGPNTVDEVEGDKVEVVNVGRVTRSKAPLKMKASGRISKNKAHKVVIQQPEEPSKHASKKSVNRRKSVLQPEKTEAVLHLEEPVNQPARKNTRRKSVMQKATKMVESSSVVKRLSKGQSGNLSVIEGEDKENVNRSGKDASENEFKEAATVSPKSRKRRGTPIIEIEYGSLVDKSPKSSTRSARKSEEKSVAKKHVESSLKKSVSRMNNQSSVENASKGKSRALRSGTIIRDSSSKKRAKVSGTKQSDSDDHHFKFSKEETPVANTGKLKLDEEVTETEVTPAIGKFNRRFTRSAIRSERKEPSQSAIKEQPIADTRLSSPKVAKFRPDPAVNTAPGRISRRGIKHGANAASSFSEKVGKAKQKSQSAHIKQSLDDAQMASPEVPEVGPNLDVGTNGVLYEIKQLFDEALMSSPEDAEVLANPDSDTAGVRSETSKEVTGQMLGDVSASESIRSPTKVLECRDPVSGTAIDMECASPLSGENAYGEVMEDAGAGIDKLTYEASATPCLTENLLSVKQKTPLELQSFDDGTSLGADVTETTPDAISDGSHVQNQNEAAYVESGIFSEAVNLETSVLESERPDAKEKETELTESGSTSKVLQIDVMIEEPLVSVGKALVMEESVNISSLVVSTKGNNGDEDNNCDFTSYDVGSSDVCHASVQQSDVADDSEQNEDESASAQKPLMSEPVSTDRDVAEGVDAQEMDSVAGDYDGESNRDDTLDQLTVVNKLEGNDTEVDTVTAHDSLESEPSTGINVICGLSIVRSHVADDTGKQLAKEHDFEVVPSTSNNIHDIPIFGKSDGEDGTVDAAKERETDSMPPPACNVIQDPLLSGSDGEEGFTTNEEHESNQNPIPDIDANDASLLGKEPSFADDIIEIPFSGNDIYGKCDSSVSDRKSCLDIFGTCLLGKGYVPDADINVPKEHENRSELSNAKQTRNDVDVENVLDDNSDAHDEEFEHDQLTSSYHPTCDEEDAGGDEFPLDDADSDLPTIKEDDRNKQGTSVDWVDYDFGMDDFEKPVSADGNVVGNGKTDDQYADFQNSVRTSSSLEDRSGLAADLFNSVRNLEKDSRNSPDGKSNKKADMLNESAKAADVIQEVFNWSDSSLKSLFTTEATTQISHVKIGQEDAVDFACRDHDSSLKTSCKTPAVLQVGQEDAVNSGNQDPYSSLKQLFLTPATSRTSYVNDTKADAVSFTFPAGRSNEDIGASGTTTQEFNHQWQDDQSKVFDGETQGNAVRGPENEMYGVPSFEYYHLKLFGDEEVGGSNDRSDRNTDFEFKGDQVDQIKPFEFLSEAAGTSHLDASCFKDKSIPSGELKKEEETLKKGSETDDLAFDTRHV